MFYTNHYYIDPLTKDIANYLQKFWQDTLTPIPLTESVSIIDAIFEALGPYIEESSLEISASNVLKITSSILEDRSIKLRWSLDKTVIWDID